MDSTGTQNYVTDGSSPASPVLKDGNAVYTPGLSEHRGSTSKFYHGDALGSTRGITDSSQSVTDSQLFDAFGNTVSRTGTTPTPFGFVGAKQYQSDSDSGLQLLGHRYYDPSTGRFLSSDPAKAGTSWYAYCDNNPLTSTDSQGLDKTKTYGDITFIFDDNGSLIGSMPSGGQTGGNSTGSSQTGGSSSSHSGSGGSITGGINDVGGHPSGNFGATYNFPGGSITGSATNIGTANTSGTFGGSYKFPGGSINGSANNIGTSNTSGSLGATLNIPGFGSINGGFGGIGSNTISGNAGLTYTFGNGFSLTGTANGIGTNNTTGSLNYKFPISGNFGGNLSVSNIGSSRPTVNVGGSYSFGSR